MVLTHKGLWMFFFTNFCVLIAKFENGMKGLFFMGHQNIKFLIYQNYIAIHYTTVFTLR